jgi:DNA-binding XRE family transcriptional regulator
VDNRQPEQIDASSFELEGRRYVILRESLFRWLCSQAGIDPGSQLPPEEGLAATLALDRASLADKLIRRRRVTGLSQAELARRAGIRPETLNRIERGRTTPDFATIRKLAVALRAAEEADGQATQGERKETENV